MFHFHNAILLIYTFPQFPMSDLFLPLDFFLCLLKHIYNGRNVKKIKLKPIYIKQSSGIALIYTPE